MLKAKHAERLAAARAALQAKQEQIEGLSQLLPLKEDVSILAAMCGFIN
jgi:hypothetical protein